jgi:hypothetical protein
VRPDPASCPSGPASGTLDAVTAESTTCAHCARAGTPADVALGWSVSTPPRATGSAAPRSAEVRALCPDCARAVLRDLEAQLDP